MSPAVATDREQEDASVLVIEPKGKRTKKIIIRARFASETDPAVETAIALHLAKWGFFEEDCR